MFCKNCGSEIGDGSLFCKKCGEKVIRTENTTEKIEVDELTPQDNVSHIENEESDFVYCKFCGNKIRPNVTFCNYCGKPAGNTENTVSEPEATSVPIVTDEELMEDKKSPKVPRAALVMGGILVILIIACVMLFIFQKSEFEFIGNLFGESGTIVEESEEILDDSEDEQEEVEENQADDGQSKEPEITSDEEESFEDLEDTKKSEITSDDQENEPEEEKIEDEQTVVIDDLDSYRADIEELVRDYTYSRIGYDRDALSNSRHHHSEMTISDITQNADGDIESSIYFIVEKDTQKWDYYYKMSFVLDSSSKKLSIGEIYEMDDAHYLLAEADERIYDIDELNFDEQDYRRARNEIFARHGRLFKNEDLQKYFYEQIWYEGEYEDVPLTELNEFEVGNIKVLDDYKKLKGYK